MTEIQREMQNRISQEELDRAFDARFPKKMQEKLRNAKVAVAGLGGLGSHIAVMLARSGIGKLRLVDFDVVDVTNLNRQMYLIPQLGKPKPEALLEILYQINPYAVYEPVCVRVTPENVKELFEDYPIVCEAFDRPDQKAMLVREVLSKIRTQRVMQRLYVCGDQKTDVGDGIGLIAPRVSACAAHEANQVLQLIMQNRKTEVAVCATREQ